MEDKAIMFLNNLSVVDHAVMDSTGHVVGGSFNPSFLVGGNIDPIEKVVVDFSTVKKQLKNAIDEDVLGFDHKLWIIEDYSQCAIYINGKQYTDFDLLDSDKIDPKSIVDIQANHSRLRVPKDSIKFISTNGVRRPYSTQSAGVWFEHYLRALFPKLDIVCRNNTDAHTFYPSNQYPISYFRYAHGLKDSSSWGCQNIAHGHLSFIQIESDHRNAKVVQDAIAHELEKTMFINRANVTSTRSTRSSREVQVSYTSYSRGVFEAVYHDNVNQKCVILDTETTIEYLTEYVVDKYRSQLKSVNAKSIFVSEGLSKGAWNRNI